MSRTPPNTSGYNTSRCLWIDAAKGFAIFLVMLSHSSFWDFCNLYSPHITGVALIKKLFSVATVSYMPLFYVLSGFTFKYRPGILNQRFNRLITPYIIWGLICLLLTWYSVCMREYTILSFIRPACGLIYSRFSLFPLGNVDNIFLFPSGASPLWFLTSLFTSYVCFIVIHRYQGFRLLIIASYIVLTIALSFLPILLPWSLDTAPAGALFIYVGYQLKEQKFFSNRLWKLLFISVIILPVYYYLISVNGGVNMSVRDYGKIPVLSPLVFLILGLLGSIVYCIFCIILERSKLVAVFAYLGRISLTILCSHSLIYGISAIALRKLSFSFYEEFHALKIDFILNISAAIIFAIILEKFFQWRKLQALKLK